MHDENQRGEDGYGAKSSLHGERTHEQPPVKESDLSAGWPTLEGESESHGQATLQFTVIGSAKEQKKPPIREIESAALLFLMFLG